MSHAPTDALSRRHRAIRADLDARELDALVVTSLPNVTYLTNFTGSAAIVVLTRDRLRFITDFRYLTAVAELGASGCACEGLEVVLRDVGGRIGVEGAHLTIGRYQWLTAALGTELVTTEGLVEGGRIRKD